MHIIKTALLSYGMSGKLFHAPFIDHHPGFQLAGSWERSQKKIQADYPDATSYPTFESLLADPGIELVIINTPTNTHFDYAKKALLANKNVVVEKAFTSSVEEGKELKALADQQQMKLSVYQNRRYDSDFRTVQKIIASKILGPLVEVEFHYDRYKPVIGPKLHKETAGPGAGLLMDLGPHLIDATLCLFGMPEAVFADIRVTRHSSKVDDYFDLLLYYPDFRVRLKASSFVKEAIPANIIHGHKGSFIKTRADVQETDLLAGKKPGNSGWGVEPSADQGILHTEEDGVAVRKNIVSEKGNYGDYYEGVYQALTSGKAVPVSAADGINTIIVIEAAVKSSAEKRIVEITVT